MFGYDENRRREEEELAVAYQCHQEDEAAQDEIFAVQAGLMRMLVGFVVAFWLALLIPMVTTVWQIISASIYCRRVRPYDASRLPAWTRQKKECNNNVSA